MTKKNVIPQDPIGDGVGARKLKARFSLSRTGHVKYNNTSMNYKQNYADAVNQTKMERARGYVHDLARF